MSCGKRCWNFNSQYRTNSQKSCNTRTKTSPCVSQPMAGERDRPGQHRLHHGRCCALLLFGAGSAQDNAVAQGGNFKNIRKLCTYILNFSVISAIENNLNYRKVFFFNIGTIMDLRTRSRKRILYSKYLVIQIGARFRIYIYIDFNRGK